MYKKIIPEEAVARKSPIWPVNRLASQGWVEEKAGRKRREEIAGMGGESSHPPTPFPPRPLHSSILTQFLLGPSSRRETLPARLVPSCKLCKGFIPAKHSCVSVDFGFYFVWLIKSQQNGIQNIPTMANHVGYCEPLCFTRGLKTSVI